MKKSIILVAILLAVVLSVAVYDYTFNSKHRDIASEAATMTLSANELSTQFQKNEVLATTNYLDKVIEINGEITESEEDELVLNNQVQVSFSTPEMPSVNEGSITIKGRCVGYDELLEMVKIDQATLINK